MSDTRCAATWSRMVKEKDWLSPDAKGIVRHGKEWLTISVAGGFEPVHSREPHPSEAVFSLRLLTASRMLRSTIEIDPAKRSGTLLVRGTRFPVSQFVAELAEGSTVSDVATDYDLSPDVLRSFLQGLAIYLDRPVER